MELGWLRWEEHEPLVQVYVGFLADQVAVAASDTLDFGQGIHDLLLAIDLRCPC